jgi:alpha-amylase
MISRFKSQLSWGIVLGLSLVLAVLLHRSLFNPASSTLAVASQPHAVFVHLFEWRWDDVAQECESYLAPNGYGAVQISPAAEHVVLPQHGFPWWQRYQPVSYQLISRSGDRSQLAQMIDRCHKVGVKIYADAVINHMAADASGIGSAGTKFDRYRYPGLYEPKDFHTCRKDIQNYNDRQQVTTCELVGLPDLATGDPSVQQRIADHMIDLARLGVDGFRIDAAKHMAAPDIAEILKRVNQAIDPDPFIYQEVLDPGNEATQKQEYYANGRVTEAEYGRNVSEKFIGVTGSIAQLETLGESWGLMPSDEAIVFIDNHDKQRGHAGGGNYLTYKNGKLYDLANMFMLAYPYGMPQVMSSYAFSNSDQGPPADAQGNTEAVYRDGRVNCFAAWRCEHRDPVIAAMVNFRNQVGLNSPIDHWWSNGSNQIAFGRGSFGFVVINRESQPLTQTLQTSLPPGDYCNVLAAEANPSQPQCSSSAIVTVNSQQQITITLEGMSALAIHTGAKASQPSP